MTSPISSIIVLLLITANSCLLWPLTQNDVPESPSNPKHLLEEFEAQNLTYQAKIDPTASRVDKNRNRLDGTVSERITRSSNDGQSSFRLDEDRQKKEATEQFSQKNLGYNQHDVSSLECLSWRQYHRENNRRPRPFVTPASKSPTVLTNPVKMLSSQETA
nr:uncharacterized protein LOC124219487 [Neodiprion pinetum]